MMKIVAFSDIHGQYRNKELREWFDKHPGDLLLFAGDAQCGTSDNCKHFLIWMNSLPYKQKILVFGNHDGDWENTMEISYKYKTLTVLHDSFTIVDGIKIYGTPWSRKFGDWFFMLPEENLAPLFDAIPDDTNILLTHSPAFGIRDMTRRGEAAGSTNLRKRIGELKELKLHVSGHIHESYGTEVSNGVTHINASVLNEIYEVANMPIIFHYGG
jgi:Icc-related predicted phosphoesterase